MTTDTAYDDFGLLYDYAQAIYVARRREGIDRTDAIEAARQNVKCMPGCDDAYAIASEAASDADFDWGGDWS